MSMTPRSVRIPDFLDAQVIALAKKRGQSISGFLLTAIENAVVEEVSMSRMDRQIREAVRAEFAAEKGRSAGGN